MSRLTPIRSEQVTDERSRRVLAWLEEHGKDVHMAHLFANAPNVFTAYTSMSDGLNNKATLAPRLRELAIVRLARRLDAEYEWWEHHRMAQNDGVTVEELDAIEADELDRVPFSAAERFVLRTADEWVDEQWRLTDRTWEEGGKLLGQAALVDLVFVLAWWGAWVPALVRAFDIDVPTGDAGAR